jgi:hypothetical protein
MRALLLSGPCHDPQGFHPLVGNCITHNSCFCQAETLETLKSSWPPTHHSPGGHDGFPAMAYFTQTMRVIGIDCDNDPL